MGSDPLIPGCIVGNQGRFNATLLVDQSEELPFIVEKWEEKLAGHLAATIEYFNG